LKYFFFRSLAFFLDVGTQGNNFLIPIKNFFGGHQRGIKRQRYTSQGKQNPRKVSRDLLRGVRRAKYRLRHHCLVRLGLHANSKEKRGFFLRLHMFMTSSMLVNWKCQFTCSLRYLECTTATFTDIGAAPHYGASIGTITNKCA